MRFYLFNRSHSANIGDQLIGAVISQTLTEAGHSVLKNRAFPADGSWLGRGRQHLRSYLSDISALWQADALIIGGGNLVMDTAGLGWAIHQAWLGMWCGLLRKDYFYLAVGANPLQRRVSQILYRFALRRAKNVSVRDSGSQAYVQCLTGRTDVIVIPDPVLAISTFYPMQPKESKVIGLCPIRFDKAGQQAKRLVDRYIALHVQLVHHFVAEGYRVQLFTNDPDIDGETAVAIIQRAALPEEQLVYTPTPTDYADYLALINSFSFLLTSRMHAAICAISYGLPCIGLAWQPKMQHLFTDLDREGSVDIITMLSQDGVEQTFNQIVALFRRLEDTRNEAYAPRSDIVAFLLS